MFCRPRSSRCPRRGARLSLLSVLALAGMMLAALPVAGGASEAEPVDYEAVPRTLSRSVSEIHGVAVAPGPSGKTFVATAHASGLLLLRNIDTGEIVRAFAGHEGPVPSVAFSPDARQLVSGGYDGSVRVWNVETGTAESVLTGHTSRVLAVTFADEGRAVVSGGSDATVRVWDVGQLRESGAPRRPAALDQNAAVYSLALSGDGERLAVGKSDGSVALWSLSERTLQKEFAAHKGAVRRLAFIPGGASLITAGDDGFVKRWNAESGAEQGAYSDSDRMPAHGGPVTALVISPRGRTLATGDLDGRIELWDVQSGRHNGMLRGHEDLVSALAFSPDAQLLLSGSYDRGLNSWRSKLPPELPLAAIPVSNAAWAVRFAPAGTTLAIGGDDGSLGLWDAGTGEPASTFSGFDATIDCLAFSPDGRQLAAAGWKSDQIGIWNLAEPEKPRLLTAGGPVRDLAFSPDGSRLAAGLESKSAGLWDVFPEMRGMQLATLPEQKQPIYAVAFSSDGRLLATGSGDWTVPQPGEVRLWDAADLAEVRLCGTHDLAVRVVAFSPDGGHLVSAGEDGVLALRDPQGRSEPRRFPNSVGTRAMAISPDGRLIAAGLHDGTVNVWDVAAGEVVRRLAGAEDFFGLSFSPDGTLLAGACGERDVLLWNVGGQEQGLAASVSSWAQRIETPDE